MKILWPIIGVGVLVGVASIAIIVALVPSCSLPTGTYTIDTVRFVLATPGPAARGQPTPAPTSSGPGIWIDTNIKISGPWGGTVESHAPYAIAFDHTDNAGDMATLEFTRVEITYDDGTVEPAAAALKTPLVNKAREYETVNSVAGGRIVRSTVRILSGKIPGMVTRDESFRLVIEGRFIKNDGTIAPFTIDQRWIVQIERASKPAGEVLQDR